MTHQVTPKVWLFVAITLMWPMGKPVWRVVDISDPAKPEEVGFYDLPYDDADMFDVVVSGDYAYVTYQMVGVEYGVLVVNITNPANPGYTTRRGTDGEAFGITLRGDYLYVATGDYGGGLEVIDIVDQTSPTTVGNYVTPGTAYDVAIGGDYAYIADGDGGLRVLNIADLTNPFEVGFYYSRRCR